MEQVAKDWSMTVRASQVMPIYPLEEDIRPGDIYLVDRSLESEIKAWNEKGFLPLVNRYDRISIPKDRYDDIYQNGFYPVDSPSFSRPPKAAFPSYSFEVDKRGTLGIALPLNSVPIALSASGARSATGSVVFKKAATQGIPDRQMEMMVRQWASQHASELKARAKKTKTESPLILRLITRIFTLKGATVSLAFSETNGASLQAGSPPSSPELSSTSDEQYVALIAYLNKQIQLQKESETEQVPELPKESTTVPSTDPVIAALEAELASVKNLKAQEAIKKLRRQIERSVTEDRFGGYILPGLSIKVVGRSTRGITMDEEFERPLVLGYWATEYLVTENGNLIFLGGLKNLLDNQKEYQNIVELARNAAALGPEPTSYDDGSKKSDPFQGHQQKGNK